jgi:hypothetical protein
MARKVGRKGNPDALKNYRETKRRETEEQEQATVTGTQVGDAELKGEFAGIFVALKQAQQKRTSKEALGLLTDAFSNLDDASVAEIINTPAIKAMIEKVSTIGEDRLPPGSYIRDKDDRVIGRVPWTERDILDAYPMVVFTPIETIPVTFQGHTIQFYAMQEIKCPSIFMDIYKQHLEETRHQGDLNLKALGDHFGPGNVTVETGWSKAP